MHEERQHLEEFVERLNQSKIENERKRGEYRPADIFQAYFDLLTDIKAGACDVFYRYTPRDSPVHVDIDYEFILFLSLGENPERYRGLATARLETMRKFPLETFTLETHVEDLSENQINGLSRGYQLHKHEPTKL